MRNATVEKKMELMQQIRSRYQKDRYDMFRREKILYGRTSARGEEEFYENQYDEGNVEPSFSTLSLRIFLAAAAFALLVLSDRTGSDILGLSAEKCFDAIGADYESSITAWAEENLTDSPAQP